MIKKYTGIKRFFWATIYSYQGLTAAFKHEAAFRQEALLAFVLLPLAFYLNGLNQIERIALVGSVVLVLIVELLNSAIEAVVDRISYEQHVLAGRAKVIGSAAVLLSLILLIFVWITILFYKN